jgi:hypothetical protein
MHLSLLQMNSKFSVKNMEYQDNSQQLEHLNKMDLFKGKIYFTRNGQDHVE